MRWTLLALTVTALAGTLYIASPFWSAWAMREAVRRGDVALLERKVEWHSVRETLRHSMTAPHPATPAGAEAAPSLWQRTKASVSAAVVHKLVDRYVTPEGVPWLASRRESLRQEGLLAGSGAGEAAWHQRLGEFYGRLRRAEFQSPTRVEIEIADRHVAERRYVSVLELIGLQWKLTGLRVITVTTGLAATR